MRTKTKKTKKYYTVTALCVDYLSFQNYLKDIFAMLPMNIKETIKESGYSLDVALEGLIDLYRFLNKNQWLTVKYITHKSLILEKSPLNVFDLD